MLAAGGTGGHLFPAYALAEELGRRGVAVDLVTDTRGDRYGTGFPARNTYQVPAATLAGRSPLAAARTVWTLGNGVRTTASLLERVRPAVVVGFGGYPSVPPLVAAWLKRFPTALHEQNAVLGRANRLLASRVSLIATSFEQTSMLGGAVRKNARLTGNPVRQAVVDRAGSPYAPPQRSQPFRLLVFGGSQGARFFSDCVPPALGLMASEARSRLRVVQQCRQEDLNRVRATYAEAGISADIAPFFTDLPQRITDAHLVIARAGASSVAELSVIGRPSILVPLPHALDNDQLRNATALAESGGAWCIPQERLAPDRFANEMEQLMRAPQKLSDAAAAARAQGRPDAAVRLADAVLELVSRGDRTRSRETGTAALAEG
jgi:UDP-N-acetylglucosamine--N-acetylmuramyl-(pentapeptide) pyrophosphoryl-undecaprenol N-acetylglucosamine transferase